MASNGLGLSCRECWWRVLVIFAAIGFFVVACVSEWPWMESPWSAASAVATAVAALVALWLGRINIASEETKEKNNASVMKICIEEDLKEMLVLLGRIAVIVRMAETAQIPEKDHAALLGAFKDAADRIEMPSASKMIDKASFLEVEQREAYLKIHTGLPHLKRRCDKLPDLNRFGLDAAKYFDSGLQIKDDIKKISHFSKVFLSDQKKYYWRSLKFWSDAYDSGGRSFHDHPLDR